MSKIEVDLTKMKSTIQSIKESEDFLDEQYSIADSNAKIIVEQNNHQDAVDGFAYWEYIYTNDSSNYHLCKNSLIDFENCLKESFSRYRDMRSDIIGMVQRLE